MMKSTYQGVLYALVGSILFSIKPVIIKLIYAVEDIDIIHLLLLRMLMSLPFYLIILLVLHKKKGLSKLSSKGKWHLVLLGFIGFYVASFLDFSGLQYIPASLERAIIFLNPTIVLLLSAVFLKRKIKPFQWLAIVLTYLGIVIACSSTGTLEQSNHLVIGGTLVFLSAFFYAIYLVGSEFYLRQIGTLEFTCYTMIVAFICIAVHYTSTHSIGQLFSLKTEVYMYTFVMAVVSTLIPSFMFSEGIKQIGAPNGSIIGGIGPVSTIFFAVLILNETISVAQLIGTFLVIGGVVIISYGTKKQKTKTST